jgi:hypothetical protein
MRCAWTAVAGDRAVAAVWVDPAKGNAVGLVLITVLSTMEGLSALVAGRPAGWIVTAVAAGPLPVDVWALRWFARSVRDSADRSGPDPRRAPIPAPGSNVRLPPTETSGEQTPTTHPDL